MSIFEVMNAIFIAILLYYLGLTIWYTLLLIASFPEVINKFRETRYGNILQLINRDHVLPITIIVPAYNEEKRILNTLYSLLGSDYKNIRIIVVNDGSTDNMMELLTNEFGLFEIPLVIKQTIKTCTIHRYLQSERYPNLMVLDKEHCEWGNSADSLNAGLNACQTPIVLSVDADTIVEPEALSRILLTFLSRKHCITVSGSIYVLNENKVEHGKLIEPNLPSRFVPAVQSVEYLRSFLYGRAGLNVFGGALCYPGAYTLFETQVLRDVGGFDTQNFANDAEITIKLHHWMRKNGYPYDMQHTPNSFSWTEVPGTVTSYFKQRDKWQRGMWRSALRHIEMLFNPKYGVVGLVSFPAFIFFEILGPVVEFTSFFLFLVGLYFHIINVDAFLWYIFLAWGFITFVSVAMVYLNLISFNKYHKPGDTLKVMGLVFGEMLWFRQCRAFVCTLGTLRYIYFRLIGRPL